MLLKYYDIFDINIFYINLVLDIFGKNINTFGEKVLSIIFKEMKIKDAVQISEIEPNILPLIIAKNPEIATFAEIWAVHPFLQNEILSSIFNAKFNAKNTISNKTVSKILTALLQSKAEIDINDLFNIFGKKTIKAILDWYDSSNVQYLQDIPSSWGSILKNYPSELIEWLEKSRNPRELTVALIVSMLSTQPNEISKLNSNIWLKLSKKTYTVLDRKIQSNILSFFLSLGLGKKSPQPYDLVARSFQLVHDALAEQEIEYQSWKVIERYLPSLSIFFNWDKCERMRRGLIIHFADNEWPYQKFLDAVKNTDTLKRIIDYGLTKNKTKKYINKLISEANTNKLSLSDSKNDILQKYT